MTIEVCVGCRPPTPLLLNSVRAGSGRSAAAVVRRRSRSTMRASWDRMQWWYGIQSRRRACLPELRVWKPWRGLEWLSGRRSGGTAFLHEARRSNRDGKEEFRTKGASPDRV